MLLLEYSDESVLDSVSILYYEAVYVTDYLICTIILKLMLF